MLENLQLLIPI